MSFQTRRNLFELISTMDIPKKEKDEYLNYLFNQNQAINQEYISKQECHLSRGKSIIGVKNESFKLKSFFEGKEGVKFIHKNGCFEQEILPHLTDEFNPHGLLRAFKFDFKKYSIIVPDKTREISLETLLRTETFSVNEMLALFAEGIKRTEEYLLSQEKKESESVPGMPFSFIYAPREPMFDISGQLTYCSPRENGKFMQDFSVHYEPKMKAWKINYYNGGD